MQSFTQESYRGRRTSDCADPFKEIVTIWECRDAFVCRHHQSHELMLESAEETEVLEKTHICYK